MTYSHHDAAQRLADMANDCTSSDEHFSPVTGTALATEALARAVLAVDSTLQNLAARLAPAPVPTDPAAPAPAAGGAQLERVTVLLTANSSAALRRAAELTGDTLTDVINRSLQTYGMMAGVVAEDGSVIVRYGTPGKDAESAPASAAGAVDDAQASVD